MYILYLAKLKHHGCDIMANKRRSRLIDKKFQLKTIITATALSTFFFTIILILFMYKTYEYGIKIDSTIESLNNSIKTEDNIVAAFVEYARVSGLNRITLATRNVRQDHMESMKSVGGNIALLKSLTSEFRWFVVIMIGIVILQAIVFAVYYLRLTHTISGPSLVINRYLQSLLDGKEPEVHELRKGDELKDIFEKVKALHEMINSGAKVKSKSSIIKKSKTKTSGKK